MVTLLRRYADARCHRFPSEPVSRRAGLALALALAAGTGASLPLVTLAQPYPTRPIRLVIGFPPGGAADIIGRIVATPLGEAMAVQVVVDNRSGAGSIIATDITARAAADGYTLLLTASTIAVNPGLHAKLPYDAVRNFAPVILLASAPNVLVAHPSLPARTTMELVDLARARPGSLNFASGGTGTLNHLSGELLKLMTGIQLNHIPYKGAAPALTDVIAGQVPLLFSSLPGALAQIRANRVHAIAVTSARRSAAAPDIPTMAESGVAGYEATNWFGVLAPAATPPPIIGRLNREFIQVLRGTEVVEAFTRQGADVLGSAPGQFAVHLALEIAKWTKVSRAAGLRAE